METVSNGEEPRGDVPQFSPQGEITIERSFTEDRLAALYDVFFPPRARDDFAFYLPLIMSATSVLDVVCGTGALLQWAREEGHAGRLCGLDPAGGMLNAVAATERPRYVLSAGTETPRSRRWWAG